LSYFKNFSDVSWISPHRGKSNCNGWFTPGADISQHRDIVMIQLINSLSKKIEIKTKLAYFKLKMNTYKSRKNDRLLVSLEKFIPDSC